MISSNLFNLKNYLNYNILPHPSEYYGLLKIFNEFYRNIPHPIPGLHDHIIDQICSNYPGKTWEQLYTEISNSYGVFYNIENLKEYLATNPIESKDKRTDISIKQKKSLKRHASAMYFPDTIQNKRRCIGD